MKYLLFFVAIILLLIVYLLSGTLEKQDEVAKSAAATHLKFCMKARKNKNYCSCVASNIYKVKTPQGIFDRATFGLFWSKQGAIKKYAPEREYCNSLK